MVKSINSIYNSPIINTNMYGSPLTLTAGQTTTTNSTPISVVPVDSADIYLLFTGTNAASAGVVTFYIATSYDDINFSTAGTAFTGILNGTTPVITEAQEFDTTNVKFIKVVKIINGDATYGLTNVNVRVIAY